MNLSKIHNTHNIPVFVCFGNTTKMLNEVKDREMWEATEIHIVGNSLCVMVERRCTK